MGISKNSISRIINGDIGLTAYKRQTEHLLTEGLIKSRVVKCKTLLIEYAGNKHQTIPIFIVEEPLNKQNTTLYAIVKRTGTKSSTRSPPCLSNDLVGWWLWWLTGSNSAKKGESIGSSIPSKYFESQCFSTSFNSFSRISVEHFSRVLRRRSRVAQHKPDQKKSPALFPHTIGLSVAQILMHWNTTYG